MIDNFEDSLLEIRKGMEKNLIQNIVAKNCNSKSKTRNKKLKNEQKNHIQDLKDCNTNYSNRFDNSVKGEWVSHSEKAFNDVLEKLSIVPLK
ncbi:MAG: hypothetical protein ACRC5R_05800 [Mycoplasmatales bacterium]